MKPFIQSLFAAVGPAFLAAFLVALPLQTPRAAKSQSLPIAAAAEDGKTAEELARDAAEKLMRALELMFQEIPQYSLPEINENGDIIIRRINPKPPEEKTPEPEKKSEPEPDATDT